VVGVSWFEAEAYCKLLSQELGRPIRLPTDEEWERAARHTDGREYPWDNVFDGHRLNCAEFWAGEDDLSELAKWHKWLESDSFKMASTTIVGQFPAGNSEAGVSDLGGNVWEWTSSWYDREKVYRAVRGSSWNYDGRSARCASRVRDLPVDFNANVGFRVLSPGSIPGFCVLDTGC